MAYIHTGRILADPLKNARLYYILEPFLPEKIDFGTYKNKKMNEIFETTKEWANNPHIIASLILYRQYHSVLKENLESLKGKKIIFIPGGSIDKTVVTGSYKPNMIFHDAFSERFRLTDEIIKSYAKLNEEHGWNLFEQYHYIPISPVILPFHITIEFKAKHSLENVVEETNNFMSHTGMSARIGATEKSLDSGFAAGTSVFSDMLFDSTRAKSVYGKKIKHFIEDYRKGAKHLDKKSVDELNRLFGSHEAIMSSKDTDVETLIEDHCYFNSFLLAASLNTICEILDLKEPTVFSRKTCYALSDVMSKVERIGNRKIDNFGKGTSPKNKETALAECDPYAQSKLRGRLLNDFIEQQKKGTAFACEYDIPTIAKAKKEVELDKRPFTCTKYPYYRCEYADACDEMTFEQRAGCLDDFVNNRFTKKDVEKLVSTLGLKVSPDELFEDLRFKKIKVKGSDKPVSEERLLRDDAYQEGYSFGNIILDRKMLNSCPDENIHMFKDGLILTRSWVEFRGSKKLEPLKIDDRNSNYQIRASEFSNKCHIARLIAKMDKDKFPKHVPENKYSVVGTARHKMANQRPWLNYLGKEEMHMAEYAEKQIAYNHNGIVVLGHSDGLFTLSGKNENYITVVDYKRAKKGSYEKPAYIIQTLLYGKGAEQALQANYDGYVSILIKRFFHGQPGEDNFPEYHMMFVPKGGENEVSIDEFIFDDEKDEIIQARLFGLDEILMNSCEIQKRLLEDKKFFFKYATKMAGKKECHDKEQPVDFRDCFCIEHCRMLKDAMRKDEDLRKYFLEGVSV